MCRILMVGDEGANLDALQQLIEQHPAAGTLQVERCEATGVARRVASQPRVDILVVPVHVGGEHEGGIRLVESLERETLEPLVVYTTTREGYTSAVYRTNHQYLPLSPFSPKEVHAALDKVLGMLGRAASAPVMLRSGGSTHVIDPHAVEYVQSCGRKVLVAFADGHELQAYAALSDLEQQLPGGFVRCHKSYLANMEYVRASCRECLTMASGRTVPVSQRQYRIVRDALTSYRA